MVQREGFSPPLGVEQAGPGSESCEESLLRGAVQPARGGGALAAILVMGHMGAGALHSQGQWHGLHVFFVALGTVLWSKLGLKKVHVE